MVQPRVVANVGARRATATPLLSITNPELSDDAVIVMP
jgi:hypothetical protein